jgi:hypothetical protein
VKKLVLLLLFLGEFLTLGQQAQAYVTYNRLGYVSCSACHFVPTGGGLLTPYGLGVQGAMSAFPAEVMPSTQRLYQGVDVRAIELNSTQGANPFLMEADYLGTAFITKEVHFDTQIGPNLNQGKNSFASVDSGWDGVALRRGLFTADLNNGNSIEAGRDAAVAGLNIDDHTSFLRMYNRRGEFDYPTQLRFVYQSDSLQILPYIDAPSFEENSDNKEYGGGFRTEYLLNNSNSVGWEGLYGNTADVTRYSLGTFVRLSEDHWNGFESEYVFTHFNEHSGGYSFNQQDVYVKPYIAIPEWLETGLVYEFLAVTSPFYQNSFQYGPEVNLRVNRFVSLLGDGRNLGISGTTNWSWYGQVFLHVEI